ncbi:MAG: hypothetical protein JNM52_00205 [Betaproteobacteria bacterium]|nr:hypothetical protein [Betaproteobacteria bacterium]
MNLNDTRPSEQQIIATIETRAIQIAEKFTAEEGDSRECLLGINIRPVDDGSTIISASDGVRLISIRQRPPCFANREINLWLENFPDDYAEEFDHALILGDGSITLKAAYAMQTIPGNNFINSHKQFPRAEKFLNFEGYEQGIKGWFNPQLLKSCLDSFNSLNQPVISFWSKTEKEAMLFHGQEAKQTSSEDLEIAGAIMPMNPSVFHPKPAPWSWLPKSAEAEDKPQSP